MSPEKMVYMANQIGTFFATQPDEAEAVEGIADHIHKFWTPGMRSQIKLHLQSGGEGLLPIVKRALAKLPD